MNQSIAKISSQQKFQSSRTAKICSRKLQKIANPQNKTPAKFSCYTVSRISPHYSSERSFCGSTTRSGGGGGGTPKKKWMPAFSILSSELIPELLKEVQSSDMLRFNGCSTCYLFTEELKYEGVCYLFTSEC